jgi:hypothetical protein
MDGVTQENFESKQSEISSSIAQALSVSTGNIQLTGSGNLVQATVYTEDATTVSEAVSDSMFVSEVNSAITDSSISASSVSQIESGTHDAIVGDGSVIYWYGNGESVTATVSVTDNVDMAAYTTEVRNIFMGAFEVPLSAVTATESSLTSFTVTVNGVISAYAEDNLAEVSQGISDSTVLPNGSQLGSVSIPEPGYTQATVTVTAPLINHIDNVDALLMSYVITQESFDLDDDNPDTELEYTVSGAITCSVRVSATAETVTKSYEEELSALLNSEVRADSDVVGSGTFDITIADFKDAFSNITYINEKANPFNLVEGYLMDCNWAVSDFVVTIKTIIQKSGLTHTQMSELVDVAQERYESEGFTFVSSVIDSFGQQPIGACEMLAECQADYEELYEMLAGSIIDKVVESETTALSWWWDFQIGRILQQQGSDIDMKDVRQKDGFFHYEVGEDTWVNTCIQHSPSWADACDNAVGVCAGGGNFGFSTQQASALIASVAQTSKVHPNCPYGCQSLGDDWVSEILEAAPAASTDVIGSLCVLESKYYLFTDALTIVDTCVGYDDNPTTICPLSDYIFCSDIDYNSGTVVYGNSTYQGYALENALLNDNYRHPQCL